MSEDDPTFCICNDPMPIENCLTCQNCWRCGDAVEHLQDHPGLCCDCFQVDCGEPLWQVNEKRADRGKPPLPPRDK